MEVSRTATDIDIAVAIMYQSAQKGNCGTLAGRHWRATEINPMTPAARRR
jgi:hypothetical protein